MAGSTTRAANIARVPARCVDRHVCRPRAGDQRTRDRDLQLLTASYHRADCRPVDDHDRRRNKLTSIHGKREALLYFSKRYRVRRKRPDDWGWSSASAQGIECVATVEDQ